MGRSFDLPEEFIKGAQSNSDGILPINSKQIQSLFSVLRKTPDPRTSNQTYRIGSVLSIVAMAVFSGHKNISEIVRFTERMKMQHRKAIGLPLYKKGSSYRKVPSYNVFYNLLSKLDIDEFGQILSQWLNSHNGSLPTALALDAKFIKDTVGIVCMVDHETGVPVAMTKVAKKEGDKGDCEMIAGRKMIKEHKDLAETVITADALHCQRATAQEIVANGGEYILQVKKNQKNLLKSSEIKTKNLPPFLT
ncbi:MAG: ISAs1 family transposase [Kiritimatiellae bacterium]|nr:ISAs1 family transposase [Kiritimatiellia bacterium]